MKVLIPKNIPCSFAYKSVCIGNKFTKSTIIYRGKNAAYEFIKVIFEEYEYCKKVMDESFNKNLIMTEEVELLQKSNNCWIYKKIISNDEDKVRDHCQVTGKFRRSAHESCNLDFQLTKKVPVIFDN